MQAHPRTVAGSVAQLYQALRDYRDRDPLNRMACQRAEARLYAVLSHRLYNWARRDLPGRVHDAKDLSDAVVSEVFQKAGQCKALDHPDLARAQPGVFAWLQTVYRSRLNDWRRGELRRARLASAQEGEHALQAADDAMAGEQAAEVAMRDRLRSQRLAADQARAAIREVIRTGQPEDVRREAGKAGVGTTLEMLNLQLQAFDLVWLQKKDTHQAGLLLGQQAGRRTLQDRVSQWVKRGRSAFLLGAQLALRQEREQDVRRELEKLAAFLAQPVKTQRRNR